MPTHMFWNIHVVYLYIALICFDILLSTITTDNKLLFFLFFPENRFDIPCKLSAMETICIKCHNLFSGKNKKKYLKMSTAENFMQSAKRIYYLLNIKLSVFELLNLTIQLML